MTFDYIFDTFGKFRKRRTRFKELEEKALSLLSSFVNGKMSSKECSVVFDGVRKEFIGPTKKDGQSVIDEDTPLWLNNLLDLHYMKWLQFQQVNWYFQEHLDELSREKKDRFDELQQMGFDDRFVETCKSFAGTEDIDYLIL